MTALWLVLLVGFAVFALVRPAAGSPVFVAVTKAVVLFRLADHWFSIVPRGTGPVEQVTVFALAVALAFLGLHRARLAGLLMVVTAVVQFETIVLAWWGIPLRDMLGASSGVVSNHAVLDRGIAVPRGGSSGAL